MATRKDFTKKIQFEFGSLARFARINDINVNSLSTVLCGGGKSQACVDALINNNIITSTDELIDMHVKSKAEREAKRQGLKSLVEPDLGYDQVMAGRG